MCKAEASKEAITSTMKDAAKEDTQINMCAEKIEKKSKRAKSTRRPPKAMRPTTRCLSERLAWARHRPLSLRAKSLDLLESIWTSNDGPHACCCNLVEATWSLGCQHGRVRPAMHDRRRLRLTRGWPRCVNLHSEMTATKCLRESCNGSKAARERYADLPHREPRCFDGAARPGRSHGVATHRGAALAVPWTVSPQQKGGMSRALGGSRGRRLHTIVVQPAGPALHAAGGLQQLHNQRMALCDELL